MPSFDVGDTAKWSWGNGTGTGKITSRYEQKITKDIQGSGITRDASADEPAFLIKQEYGSEVLKKHTEIKQA